MPWSCCPLYCGYCWPWKHPEVTLGSWSCSQAIHTVAMFLTSGGARVKEGTYFLIVSFSVLESVTDTGNSFNFLAIFVLIKRLSKNAAAQCVTRMHVLHWAFVPSVKPWNLRRCSLADPAHWTVMGGQHCTLTCRQKAGTLYLKVNTLNLEELQQKDNAREPFSRYAMKMAPSSSAISL